MKTIIEMAREAGVEVTYNPRVFAECWIEDLERFAALVRAEAKADEREACAKVCDEVGQHPSLTPRHCAEAIRERGNT